MTYSVRAQTHTCRLVPTLFPVFHCYTLETLPWEGPGDEASIRAHAHTHTRTNHNKIIIVKYIKISTAHSMYNLDHMYTHTHNNYTFIDCAGSW